MGELVTIKEETRREFRRRLMKTRRWKLSMKMKWTKTMASGKMLIVMKKWKMVSTQHIKMKLLDMDSMSHLLENWYSQTVVLLDTVDFQDIISKDLLVKTIEHQ